MIYLLKKKDIADDDVGIIDNGIEKFTLKESTVQNNKEEGKKIERKEKNHEGAQDESLPQEWRYTYSHPKDQIIGDPS